jgi:hypothetical protein
VAAWKSEKHRRDHYALHRAEFGNISLEEYDASAQDTLKVGTYFEYLDERTDEWRTGCYHRDTRRLTVLDADDLIVSRFRCSEWYVETLTDSTYG